jgi:hypothetical protein
VSVDNSVGRQIGDNIVPKHSRLNCSYECNGFLDESYKCMVCSKLTCRLCFNNNDEDHDCSNIIKQCPNCNEYITKDEGCNNVKCVKCNVFFNWNSGKIINNKINISIDNFFPKKYIEFNKLDLSSMSDIDKITLHGIYKYVFEFIRFKALKIIDILNSYIDDKYKINRINYLNNKINKTKFYRNIIKQSKLENYKLYIINIILLAYQKAVDIFNNGDNYLIELNEIINNSNEMIINITKYFKYNNNIKILHWFNLNDIDKLMKL